MSKEIVRYYRHPITGEIVKIPETRVGSIAGGFKNSFDAIKWMRQWDFATAYIQGNKNVRYNAVTNLFELKH